MLNGKKTYIGIFIAALPTLAGFVGFSVDPALLPETNVLIGAMVDNVEAILQTGGALIAIVGRMVTKK